MDYQINEHGHRVTPNQDRHLDFFLRALGFPDRDPLAIVARDDKLFRHAGIVAKPDWGVYDHDARMLYIVDYKNRCLTETGPTAYEIHQVAITGMVAANHLSKEWGTPISFAVGLLYANDRKIEVDVDADDLSQIINAREPARAAYLARGHQLPANINATRLAKYMAHMLDRPVDQPAAAEGTRVQAKIVEMAPRRDPNYRPH